MMLLIHQYKEQIVTTKRMLVKQDFGFHKNINCLNCHIIKIQKSH